MFYLYIFMLLIVPQKNYFVTIICYLLITLAYLLLSLRSGGLGLIKPKAQYAVILSLPLLAFVISCVRLFFYSSEIEGYKDFTDLGRFLPIYMVLFFAHPSRLIDAAKLYTAFCAYFVIDFFVTVLQFLRYDLFGIVEIVFQYYSVETIYDWIFLGPTVRAPGLSPGFGEHGVFLCIFIAYSAYCFALSVLSRRKLLIMIALAVSSLLMSQSRTALAALLITLFIVSVFALAKYKSRTAFRFVFGLICMATFAVFLLPLIASNVPYLYRIFEVGISTASVDARYLIWDYFLSFVTSDYLLLLLGAGREMVGAENSVYDNDFIFTLVTYGLPLAIVFYGYFVSVMARSALYPRPSSEDLLLIAVLFVCLVSSYGLIVFTHPSNLILILLTIRIRDQLRGCYDKRLLGKL